MWAWQMAVPYWLMLLWWQQKALWPASCYPGECMSLHQKASLVLAQIVCTTGMQDLRAKALQHHQSSAFSFFKPCTALYGPPNRTQCRCRVRQPPSNEPILYLNGDGQGLINNATFLSNVAPSYAPSGQVCAIVCWLEGVIDRGGISVQVLVAAD